MSVEFGVFLGLWLVFYFVVCSVNGFVVGFVACFVVRFCLSPFESFRQKPLFYKSFIRRFTRLREKEENNFNIVSEAFLLKESS